MGAPRLEITISPNVTYMLGGEISPWTGVTPPRKRKAPRRQWRTQATKTPEWNGTPRMREIALAVCARHGLALAELRSLSAKRAISHPRQEAMALLRSEGRYSYPQIGRFFGRHHTTVIHGERAYWGRVLGG